MEQTVNRGRTIMSEGSTADTTEGKLVSINEFSLWKDFRSGDVSAYSLIYRKYFFALYSYGKKFSTDKELIEDCIQDLFVKIWNNRENLADTTSIKYYLFVSLKRKLVDALKSPGIRLKSEEDVVDFEMSDSSEADNEAAHFQRDRVLKAMTRLSKHQQKILEMKFYQNQSNQEIATHLGITIQSVYNLVFKTLRSLRKQMHAVLWLFLLNW